MRIHTALSADRGFRLRLKPTMLLRRSTPSTGSGSGSRAEGGFTLVELIITIALLSAIMAISTPVIIGILTNTQAESLTIRGLEQSELAGQVFTQYLRSAVSLVNIQTNDLTFTTYAGTVSGVPQLQTIEAELCPTSSAAVDQLEIFFGLPPTGAGSTGIHTCAQSGSTTTTSIPAGIRLVQAFDVQPPKVAGSDIFQYYTLSGNSLQAMGTSGANGAQANPNMVQAVGLSMTFMPRPGSSTEGYHAELGTTVQTVSFLRN